MSKSVAWDWGNWETLVVEYYCGSCNRRWEGYKIKENRGEQWLRCSRCNKTKDLGLENLYVPLLRVESGPQRTL